MSTIGERLREARKELGLSQEDVAARAKVSQSTIGNLESGIRQSPRELLAIAAAVNLTPEFLKTGRGPKHPAQVLHLGGTREPESAGGLVVAEEPRPPAIAPALHAVLAAVAGLSRGQWEMIRGRFDTVIGHPEVITDVVNDVQPLLSVSRGKRYG